MRKAENSVLQVICEFIEAFSHQVLFLRGVYSADLFDRHRLYGIVVRRSRHPELNQYITQAVESLKEAIKQHTIDKVAISIASPAGYCLEKHILQLQVAASASTTADWQELQAALRASLLRLQNIEPSLRTLPEGAGCTFEFLVEQKAAGQLDVQTWVEAETEPAYARAHLVPIKSSEIGNCKKGEEVRLQIYVQQFA